MKTTSYFDFRHHQPDRAWIQDEWIEQTIADPVAREVQSDGRIRLWRKIEQAEGRYLRVILLRDEQTVHHAFFDRDYKE